MEGRSRKYVGVIRIIGLILACSFFISATVACADKKNDTNANSGNVIKENTDNKGAASGAPRMTGAGVLPIVDEEVTLVIGLGENPTIIDYETNDFTKWAEEQTGINLEFDLLPGSDTKQKFELMVASNSKLPDILFLSLTASERANYGRDGVFIPLDEHLEKYGHFFELELAKENASLKDSMIFNGRSPDGKIYSFPTTANDPTSDYALQWYINQTWLDSLSMKAPTTTDNLYEVLKAFKEKDPNKNGKSDEIPMVGGTGWNQQIDLVLINSFTYAVNHMKYFILENDKVDVCYTQPEYRDALRYVHKLCKEGLFSPLTFTQDSNQLQAMLNLKAEQDSYVGMFAGAPSLLFTADNQKVFEYEAIGPVAGPEGVCWSPYRPNSLTYIYWTFVTKDCKTPEIAVRFLDFLKSEEASLRGRFGVKDKDWKYVSDGSGLKSALDPLGYKAIFETDDALWGHSNNSIWNNNSALLLTGRIMAGKAEFPSDNTAIQHRKDIMTEGFILRYGKRPDNVIESLLYTHEENDEISEIATTIISYVNESKARFIVGELDIEKDWDKYISDLNSMGLKRYIEVTQACYNRTKR